ncbi:putative secreted protein (Por secretion system target) [Gelidibacter algens]|uniref:Putative secreted protein (Por secretion system target) n=1 Tax=Gelidibacter algens TaxID=49280 RepID=A0A1A7R2U8_9FLAO|nr:T9SS type A sorting domain-containing protein [Gelidibacter algens]OBX25092.1 hypothetical protein A9996_11895 [Gelidibacter algens]RAJ23030.1 putative secreted protein (Por secretion system target) [Gelidibacter algens]
MKKYYVLFAILLITLASFAQPKNDDCTGAEVITVTNVASTVNFDIVTAALTNQTICATTTNFADVWYQFTMPFNGNVYVDGFTGWNNFALYDACGGNQIMCINNSGLLQNLTANTVYTLRVYRTSTYATNPNNQLFSIQAFQEVTNDDCNTAQTIAVTTNSTTVNFEIAGAHINYEAGCGSSTPKNYSDIWYDFTMPVDGNIYISGGLATNNFALYDMCNGTQMGCFIQSGLFTNLTSGSTYKLRVFRTSTNTASNLFKSFTIQAFQEVTNDNCENAQPIAVTTNSTTIDFEIAGANINNEVGCGSSTAQNYADIWYDFTMPVNGNLHIDGGLGVNNFALYDTCNSTQIDCFIQFGLFSNLTSGNNYKLRVFRTSGNAANTLFKSFTIQAFEHPANDACSNAGPISVSTTELMVNFEIRGASIANQLGCEGNSNQDYADIWYNFTMPEDGAITIDGFFSGNYFALYDACDGIEIACFNDTSRISNLASGSNFKLRLFRTLENLTEIGINSFSIILESELGVSDESQNVVKLYPNPATETVHVSSVFPLDKIEMFDILGQQIITVYNTNLVNVGKLKAGVYFIKIHTPNGSVPKKMIKK